MTTEKRPTFEQTRKLFNITRNQISTRTNISVDYLWALEKTGRGTKEIWEAVIDALNQVAKTDYKPEDFSNVTIADWPIVKVE
jgi:hypothetical protein